MGRRFSPPLLFKEIGNMNDKPTITPAAPAPKPAFDLGSLNTSKGSDEGAEIELVHPVTGAPLGVFITVLGKHSEVFREAIRERTNANVRKRALAERRGKEPELPTAERMEADATELLILCTVSWRTGDKPTITFEGRELEFNVPNAKLIYEQLIWLRTQVDEAIGSLELFIKP
jgi:hypothetical protein